MWVDPGSMGETASSAARGTDGQRERKVGRVSTRVTPTLEELTPWLVRGSWGHAVLAGIGWWRGKRSDGGQNEAKKRRAPQWGEVSGEIFFNGSLIWPRAKWLQKVSLKLHLSCEVLSSEVVWCVTPALSQASFLDHRMFVYVFLSLIKLFLWILNYIVLLIKVILHSASFILYLLQ